MTLNDFVIGWLTDSPISPPIRACESVNGNAGVTLYRDDKFQVQLWIFPPGAKVTDHAHPGIDTQLVWVAGKLRFHINGEYVCLSDTVRVTWRDMKTWTLHVPPGVVHGADIGDSGASFLSITEQLDGTKPRSVHLTWEGPPLDPKHGEVLAGRA